MLLLYVHPTFYDVLLFYYWNCFQCQLLLANDGSGKGAALAAAIAMKLRSRANGVSWIKEIWHSKLSLVSRSHTLGHGCKNVHSAATLRKVAESSWFLILYKVCSPSTNATWLYCKAADSYRGRSHKRLAVKVIIIISYTPGEWTVLRGRPYIWSYGSLGHFLTPHLSLSHNFEIPNISNSNNRLYKAFY